MTTERPLVLVIGTGGTISGQGHHNLDYVDYMSTGRTLRIDEVLARVPELDRFAHVQAEQFESGSSTGITPEHWARLARRINTVFRERPDVAGVVVTHGTAALEETAYFLDLTVKSDRSVVVTGAMRPPSSIGTDADANLMAAVRVAASAQARDKGVLVTLNDEIHAARDVTKTDAHRIETFQTPHFGMLGYADSDLRVVFYRSPVRRHTHQTEFNIDAADRMPRVDIVYSYAGADGSLVSGIVAARPDGIVLAGTGSGNSAPGLEEALQAARKSGIAVVLTTHVGSGRVTPTMRSERLGFIPGDNLTPKKARILLMLALTVTRDPARVQAMFETY